MKTNIKKHDIVLVLAGIALLFAIANSIVAMTISIKRAKINCFEVEKFEQDDSYLR